MDQESPDGEFPPCVPKGRKPFHTPPGPGLFDADPSPGPFNTTPWSYPFAGQNKDGQKKGRAPHIPSTRALREGPRQSLSRSWYAAMYAGWEQQGLPRAQIARNKQDIARILETYIKPLPRKALESADIQRVINRVLVGHVRNLGLRVQIKQSPLLKKVKQEILSLKARISEDLLQATVNICLRQEREGERLHEVQNKDLFGEILIEDLLKGIVKGVMAFIHEKDCVAMSRRLPDEQVGEALGKAVLFEDNPQDLSRLLKMGLPADIKDPQGTTALEKAILLHRKDAVEVLLQHGGGARLKKDIRNGRQRRLGGF